MERNRYCLETITDFLAEAEVESHADADYSKVIRVMGELRAQLQSSSTTTGAISGTTESLLEQAEELKTLIDDEDTKAHKLKSHYCFQKDLIN